METLIDFLKNLELVISSYPPLIQVFIWGFMINIFFILCISVGSFIYFKIKLLAGQQDRFKVSGPIAKEHVSKLLIGLLKSNISYTRSEIHRLLKSKLKNFRKEDRPFYTIAFINIVKQKTDLKHSRNYHTVIDVLMNLEKNDSYLNKTSSQVLFKPQDYRSITHRSKTPNNKTLKSVSSKKTEKNTASYMNHKAAESNSSHFNFELHQRLNNWEQMCVFNKLIKIDRADLPDFKRLLTPDRHPSQLCVLCRLIAYFKDFSTIGQLEYLLVEFPNPNLKKEIVRSLSKLNAKGSVTHLCAIFPLQNEVCKTEIIENISKFPSDKVLNFLKRTYQKTPDNQFKMIVANALYNLNASGRSFIVKRTAKKLSKIENKILLHIQNGLTNATYSRQDDSPKTIFSKTILNDLTNRTASN